jgi:hypothetical protein
MASSIGVLGTSALESLFSRGAQNSTGKFKQAFQQLGQDLQSGNLAQAETDLAKMQPGFNPNQPTSTTSSTSGSSTTANSSTSSSSSGTFSQAMNQIAQDLQSGNLTAAQSDYTNLQQNLRTSHAHFGHMHAGSQGGGDAAQQELAQLGQALQSGNLGAAQQAYATLQTALPGFMTSGSTAGASSGSTMSVTA